MEFTESETTTSSPEILSKFNSAGLVNSMLHNLWLDIGEPQHPAIGTQVLLQTGQPLAAALVEHQYLLVHRMFILTKMVHIL